MNKKKFKQDIFTACIVLWITICYIFMIFILWKAYDNFTKIRTTNNSGPIVITKPNGPPTVCTSIGGKSSTTLICS